MEARVPIQFERTPPLIAPVRRTRPERDAIPAEDASPKGLLATGAVVAVCDLSSAALNATWRAAIVARELGAQLRILHPHGDEKVLSKAGSALDELREEIRQRMRVRVEAESVRGSVLHAAIDAARQAAMIVIPSQRGNPLREWIMGTQAERLIRLCRAPVLVVKRPALCSYRRVLVAAGLEGASASLIAVAAMLSRGSRVEVLHVLATADEVVLRELEASAQVLHTCREYRAQRARVALHELVDRACGDANGTFTTVGFGRTAGVVLERAQAVESELIVIGKKQRGLLAGYLLGGVTQRVLANAGSDVLVLPAGRC
jgi:nucleotide-binding universal stress UspA family protein